MTTSALQISQSVGAITSSSVATVSTGVVPTISVRLEAGNFTLWKGLLLPNLAGAGLHLHLDESVPAPEKTVT